MDQNLCIDEEKLNEYSVLVKDWCLVNGLLCLTKNNESTQSHDSAYPVPVTLTPTRYPKKDYEFALNIQRDFNELCLRISNDYEFLKNTLHNIIKYDDFTRHLWDIYETVLKEGIQQPITFSILRNDFMLDENKEDKITRLSQIEINTISCSFGASTSQLTRLHKAKVAFVVSQNERNIGDQRLLEYKCVEIEPSIKIIRYTLRDIYQNGKLDEQKRLIINNEDEIALVYYRVGYDPKDYTSENEWEARLLVERSKAIKSPSIQMHLVGCKRIQQALCEPNVLERFIKDKEVSNKIRATFVDQYSFDETNIEYLTDFMLKNCADFVLKPQREGGGNNIYKEDIKNFYETLSDKKELMGYILMKLVKPLVSQNYIVKVDSSVKKDNLISEIGIFGVIIGNNESVVHNETGGYLLRTKPVNVNEGGVATGYSALDSIILV